jgi:hypothetical protein
MVSLILLGISVLFVVIFAIIESIDESSRAQKMKDELKEIVSFNTNWTIKGIIYRISPLLIGVGFMGLLVDKFWIDSTYKLITISTILGLVMIFTILQPILGKKTNNSSLLSEILLCFNFFSVGAFLFALNEFVVDQRLNGQIIASGTSNISQIAHNVYLMGSTEIISLWIMIGLVFAYISRSAIQMSITSILCCVFYINYFLNEVNIVKDIFRYAYQNIPIPYHINHFTCFIFPFILAIICPVLYGYHQTHRSNISSITDRIFYYLSGILSFVSIGSLITYSLWQIPNKMYYIDLIKQTAIQLPFIRTDIMYLEYLFAAVALVFFLCDQYFKKAIKGYNANYFVAVVVATFGIIGYIAMPSYAFLGFYCLSLPFVSWLMVDYLRGKSNIAMILFYIFNSVLLWFYATDSTRFDWFSAATLLGIMIYAAKLHPENRLFSFYTLLSIVFSIIVLLFGISYLAFTTMIVLGIISLLISTIFPFKFTNK